MSSMSSVRRNNSNCLFSCLTHAIPNASKLSHALLTVLLLQIPHLVELGINAVELLPVFEYDELEFQRIRNPRDHMVNIWGYSHINFFAPMSRYAADGAGPSAAAREFKHMVQQLHKAGIEVILDVVYNHTAEGACLALMKPLLLSTAGSDCLSAESLQCHYA